MFVVRECHILSVNFISQQLNKSFDVTEIVLALGFADGFFRRSETKAGKPSVFAGYVRPSTRLGYDPVGL